MNIFKRLFLLLSVTLLVAACQRDRDKYYEKPSWGGEPLYDVLKAEGRFGLYLQLVERSSHLENFKGNGYWTVFAPNDEAMATYLNGRAVADLTKEEVEKVVSYSMLFTKFSYNHLTDVLYGGWDTLQSVKKKTPYYETLHKEDYKGQQVWVANPPTYSSLTPNDNNYKYLPMYLERNFSASPYNRPASDYERLYGGATYTGRNVQRASILKADMEAANGVAHEVDYVNEPLPNLEDLLKDEEYSLYRELLELKTGNNEPYYYSYVSSPWLNEYYKNIYPDVNEVYLKWYNVPSEFLRTGESAIAIPLNVERYFLGSGSGVDEKGGYTLFAPNNEGVQKFYDDVVKGYADEGYTSVASLPNNIRRYFINAQMSQRQIYPSEYAGALNAYENPVNGMNGGGLSPETKVKPASNGIFYGSSSYVKTHWFESVLTEVLMRPLKYEYLSQALQKYFPATLWEELGEHCPLRDFPDDDYTVLLLTTDQLKADGFDWYLPSGQVANDFRHSSAADGAQLRMERLVRSHIFKRKKVDSIGNFKGDQNTAYDGYSYALNDNGDMVRYKDGQLQMAGNYANSEWVTPTLIKTFSNGRVFAVDKLLQYSPNAATPEMTLVDALKRAMAQNPNVSTAAEWLIFLLEFEKAPLTISTAAPLTLLLPSNAAMRALELGSRYSTQNEDGTVCTRYKYQNLADVKNEAAKPSPDGCVNYLQAVEDMKEFFRYHQTPGMMYINDNLPNVVLSTGESYVRHVAATAYKDGMESTLLTISKDWIDPEMGYTYNNLRFSTMGRDSVIEASVVTGVARSNMFGPKVVIHEINRCLLYPPAIGY